MKIIEYKTATADSPALLDAEVNKLLPHGFQLYGNPYYSGNKLAQAMVKCGLRDHPSAVEVMPTTAIAT